MENPTPSPITELSETEQEKLSGGFRFSPKSSFFLFQDTAIDTFAENQTDIDTGGVRGSSLSRTGYSFRQTTLAFFSFGGARSQGNPFSQLFAILKNFL